VTTTSFYTRYVKLPHDDQVPAHIRKNGKFHPFFENCLGALDGTHVWAHVPSTETGRYRDRKGAISQNVLAACTFDMQFCYILSGWEGSAADARILHEARQQDFAIPAGKFYLADAGFSLSKSIMVPYRNVRYHLKEWGRSNQRCVIYCICICQGVVIHN
jgi:hypothetical protein